MRKPKATIAQVKQEIVHKVHVAIDAVATSCMPAMDQLIAYEKAAAVLSIISNTK